MENPEEILHSLEEFAKLRPKDIPRELEDYLCFVAKTGDPVYQWSIIKSLFREKLINVITEFYESCPTIDIPPCPNVDMFNYEAMKNFILEKLDTFASAPFTVQRICELLTTPRKEYNRIDKYMRALEKNILVVSTTEPGNNRRSIEIDNPEGIVNGLENDHIPVTSNTSNDINVEEMDDSPSWPRTSLSESASDAHSQQVTPMVGQESFASESRVAADGACSSSVDTVITCRNTEEPYVFIEPVPSNTCRQEQVESDVSVTITAIPTDAQKHRDSPEPVVSTEAENTEENETVKDMVTETVPESSTNEAEQAEQVIATVEAKPDEEESSEADKTVDSTSQVQVTEEKDDSQTSEMSCEDTETSDNVESTSTIETPSVAAQEVEETTPKDSKSEVSAGESEVTSGESEVTLGESEVKVEDSEAEKVAESEAEKVAESEAEKVVESSETSVSPPPVAEDATDIPKHESESEENSKDSEVSSSSSSVTSNDEDTEDTHKQSGDQIVPDFNSEKEANVGEGSKESNEAENKQPEEEMQVDETGDARSIKQDEQVEEVAESRTEETKMDVEVTDSEKPSEKEESTTTSE